MSVVHRVRRRQRSLVLPLVLVPLLLTSSVALAADDESATDTVVGELVQAWADPAKVSEADDEQYASPLTWVETDDGETVRIPTDQVEDLPVGATVEVAVGDEVLDEASEETGLEPAREVLAAEVVAPAADPPPAPAAARLTNQVTVVMVVPQGGVQDSTTLTQVVDAVNGPVATFWSEESQGAIRIGVTASHDWMATTASCSTPTALWDEVAGAVGFTPGPGKHLLLYVTSAPASLSGCSYGLGQVGSGPASGGRMYVRDTVTSVIAHELGHNFRLGHSSGRQCDGAIEAGTCRTVAYRDDYDVMGVSWEQVGSLNAAQANLLNVLPGAQTATVLASGAGDRLTLAPLSGRSGIRAARLVDDDGQEYWLEYRTASGRDAWLTGSSNRFGLQAGVLLHRGTSPSLVPAPSDTSLLLDGTPSVTTRWDADMQTALPVGTAVSVSGGDLTVSVESQTSAGAVVQVGTRTPPRFPVGFVSVAKMSGSSVVVSGWALDPDAPATSTPVHVYMDGRPVAVVTADGPRQDVGSAFPGAGDAHGFTSTTVSTPGAHTVCVYGIDVTSGPGNSLLGCQAILAQTSVPIGAPDVTTSASNMLTVSGWALDPDSPATSIPVHVYIDGRPVAVVADGPRLDVGASFPGAGNAHGFTLTTAAEPGTHTVCAYGIDMAAGPGNSLLGCRAVVVRTALPVGALDLVTSSSNRLTVSGWALDPDAPGTSIPVHVYVDGGAVPVVADGARPDVGASFPGAGGAHGFSLTTTVAAGLQTVCVYGIDVAAGPGNSLIGCQIVWVKTAVPVGRLDVATSASGALVLSGWALDPDSPATSIPVHIYVAGHAEAVVADRSRPDVGSAYLGAGDAHGFSLTTTAVPGRQTTICAYGIDVAGGPGNSLLGCQLVNG